jgi:tetratricopeptide (TPR) repeat protein
MKCCSGLALSGLRNQKGTAVYTVMGIAILVVVVVGMFLYFPWKQVFKGKQDPDLVAGLAAMADKQWEKAVSHFDKAIKRNPGNAEAYVDRSKAFVYLGKLDKAFDDANTAVQKSSDKAIAYGQRGIVSKLQGKIDKALQDFSQAVKLNPKYAWAYAQSADIHSRNKEPDKALADVDTALKINPNFIEAYRLKAWVLNRMGRCKEASDAFKKVEKLSPNDAWSIQDKAWFLLTCPDEKLQDASKAMELAQKALKLTGGKDGLVHETLAEAYFRQGDPLKAVDHQKKAIELGSQRCPDVSCVKEMQQRLKKYEMAARQEVRTGYEILPLDSGK